MLYKDELQIDIFREDQEAISQLSDKGVARDAQLATEYVWLLEYDDFQRLRNDGYTIYLTPDAARSTYAVFDYRPGYFDAVELPFAREGAPWAGGAATTDR
jgi:hypothetical protein